MASFLDLTTGLPALWAKIKGLITQSNWEEDDTTSSAHVLNRPAIRAGDGENSVVVGQIEQDEDAAIARITFDYPSESTDTILFSTNEDISSFPASTTALRNVICNIQYTRTATTGVSEGTVIEENRYYTVLNLDKATNTITFGEKINAPYANFSYSIVEATLYSKYKISSGKRSIAEGSCTNATGNDAHAEGLYSKAMGAHSHAEGSATVASGTASHTEGVYSKAYGLYSHAEGSNTIASSNHQHVQGKFNIEDANSVYADIVGNGTSSARSNAYTLDWSGNGWYAGKVTVGAQPTADMDVATKKYVDDIEIPQPEDDTLVLNLLTEYGYAAPIADASGNVITEDDGTLVLG